MRTRFAFFLLTLAIVPHPVAAQYAAEQAGTLTGLEKVLVVFAEPSSKVGPQIAAEIYQAVTLELRKVGVRVVTEGAELDMSRDGVLNISLFIDTGLQDTGTLRMDVEQQATLVRTGVTSQMVTWFYEASQTGTSWRDWISDLTMGGVNQFLSDWLDGNGR